MDEANILREMLRNNPSCYSSLIQIMNNSTRGRIILAHSHDVT